MKLALVLVALVWASCGSASAQSEATVFDAITHCAPIVDHGVMVGIIGHETSTSPWTPLRTDAPHLWEINDNTTHRSIAFPSYQAAVRATEILVYKQHHIVAIGIGQIRSTNLSGYGVTVAQAFLPCTNISLAQRVLWWGWTYATTTLHIPPSLDATHVALQLYYAGSYKQAFMSPDALAYADDVMNRAAAFNASYVPPAAPLAIGLPMPEHRWPTRGTTVPFAASAYQPQVQTSPPITQALTPRQLQAARDQRRINAMFHPKKAP